jgi:ElaB/YqjD/DUF883 family membrane-anchored ribosome-binding protein
MKTDNIKWENMTDAAQTLFLKSKHWGNLQEEIVVALYQKLEHVLQETSKKSAKNYAKAIEKIPQQDWQKAMADPQFQWAAQRESPNLKKTLSAIYKNKAMLDLGNLAEETLAPCMSEEKEDAVNALPFKEAVIDGIILRLEDAGENYATYIGVQKARVFADGKAPSKYNINAENSGAFTKMPLWTKGEAAAKTFNDMQVVMDAAESIITDTETALAQKLPDALAAFQGEQAGNVVNIVTLHGKAKPADVGAEVT